MKRQVKLFTVLFVLSFLTSSLCCMELHARGVMGACTRELYENNTQWYYDVSGFVSIIRQYASGYSEGFSTYNPYPYMWIDTYEGGLDHLYADYYEASLILGHAGSVLGGKTSIGFAPNGNAWADEVYLGYKTYQGKSIFTFIVQCGILRDTAIGYWKWALNGAHMILSFKSEVTNVTSIDCRTLAKRLTGVYPYPKDSVRWAFIKTFIANDDAHKNNVVRIIAEDNNVAYNDYIDQYNPYITVDSSKYMQTWWLGSDGNYTGEGGWI